MKLNYEELKLAAHMTRDWPEGSGIHTDVHYDRSTGHVWTRTEYGDEVYTLSGNPDEIIVAKTVRRTGVAELLAAIDKAVALDDQCRAYLQDKTNEPEA